VQSWRTKGSIESPTCRYTLPSLERGVVADMSSSDEENALNVVTKYAANGLPEGDEAARAASAAASLKMVVGTTIVSRPIGIGIAFAIYYLGGTVAYDANAKLAFNADGAGNGAYVFFSAVIFSFLTFWLNFYPMIPKARVMLKDKNIRTNMYIYKVNEVNTVNMNMPRVILDEEGDCGKYNRANRSMHHFTEYAAACAFTAICASFVFPFPVFILMIILATGRLWHQFSYSNSGYGAHAGGFMLFMVAYVTLEMLALLAGIKQIQLGK